MYMLMMVLDDSSRLNEVLEAWIAAGVKGVTVLESTGVNRLLTRISSSPSYAGFAQMFGSGRVGHNTLFAVIDDLELADQAVAKTEEVLGDLTKPHTGIVFALPIARTWGLPEPYHQ